MRLSTQPRPFDQLRNFAIWWSDHGKTATCCRRATDEEIREDPEAFDCSQCELVPHLEGLWPENAEAWNLYQQLCGRTVRECQLEGWLLERVTSTWDFDRVATLLERLDVLAGVLSPSHGTAQN